jgi:hypothetical protein
MRQILFDGPGAGQMIRPGVLTKAGYPDSFETKIYAYVTSDLPELHRLAEAVADYPVIAGWYLCLERSIVPGASAEDTFLPTA